MGSLVLGNKRGLGIVHFWAFTTGLVMYLTMQSIILALSGVTGWAILVFGVIALVLAQILYLIVVAAMASLQKRSEDAAKSKTASSKTVTHVTYRNR